jgi:hypothetical protein
MQYTKNFILVYAIFYLILSIFDLPLNIFLTDIPYTNNLVIDILLFFPKFIIFLVNFLLFTTPYFYINIILWAIRFIGIIEIIQLIRGTN